jgi:type IV secretory pathway VirD2 relaxase
MSEVTVYQVRAIDSSGNKRIVHAYETEEAAKNAIMTMRKRSGCRYDYVAVPNQPATHWGINFPDLKRPQ